MQPVDPRFEALLRYLEESRGFDVTGYSRPVLMRRVRRRMSQVDVADCQDYVDYLEVHPDEFTALFDAILLNATGFFRDPESWDYLRRDVLDAVLSSTPAGSPIRVWSAACASGEEAYTLAISLAEALGPEAFRDRVKIYATDVDEEQLNRARQGTYGERDLHAVPRELVERYFEPTGNRYTFRKDLRPAVIFGRNDLVKDAPISRINVLTCRNALVYFTAETQFKVLKRFHFALAEGGVLFLGKAEMPPSHASLLTPIDVERRVFRRASPAPQVSEPIVSGPMRPVSGPVTGMDQLRGEAFAASPPAQLVLTADGLVALTNRQLETLFGVSAHDVGRPFRELDLSFRPAELRRFIEQAQVERRTSRVTDVEFRGGGGELTFLEIQVSPLTDGERLLGASVIFHDVTAARRLQEDLEQAKQKVEAAYEELQSTNEELETTNEELQSTVEELETTNEELQSTNEELETINEELQSTNDELQSINDQLRISTVQLDEANSFLEAVLTSLRSGVAVVDRDLRVRMWNRHAEELWGLRAEEIVGQHFLNLDIGLPLEQLRPLLRGAFGADAKYGEAAVEAVNRRGRSVLLRVACTPLNGPDGGRPSERAVVVMETRPAPLQDTDRYSA
jgi:two-component system, chemotaxis family, CheB/CheR fusion protein